MCRAITSKGRNILNISFTYSNEANCIRDIIPSNSAATKATNSSAAKAASIETKKPRPKARL
jgi:hypothetical protein